jgi:hypothetical protein
VCQRLGTPGFGGLSTYIPKRGKQLVISYRGFRSSKHFQGTHPFPELDANGPQNEQNQINVDFTYAVSERFNLSVNVPFHLNSFSVRRPRPGSTDRVWQKTNSSGLGDISARARYWLMSTERDDRNIGVTVGLKIPTGKADRTDDVFGRQVPVDISVQTGDKGWGVTTGVQAFKRIDRVTVYGNASYLFNPRNTTGTPTFFGSLTNPNNTQINSASDQFSTQIGVSVRIKRHWPVPSVAYRFEGVPVRDRFGKSDGFRRPGAFGFIEPGFTVPYKNQLYSFGVAFRQYVNVKDAPNSVRIEDATIPKYMVFAAYSVRF